MIHLNGTAGEDLHAEYRIAVMAVDVAIQALQAVTVHARDYYPKGESCYRHAAAEHRIRLTKLQTVYDELTEIQINLGDQLRERRRA
jgi:hypothetical protein